MRGKGITYDTGFFLAGTDSHPSFDPDVVRREMRIIARDLHCTAVRITGGDPGRLGVAARHAAEAGLEVWFAPFPCELTTDELGPYFAECAERAEEERRGGTLTVLVIGGELTLFDKGFLPGANFAARMTGLTGGDPAVLAGLGDATAKLNSFLGETVKAVRERFGGPVTYASGPWEQVDWTPFDIVSVDAYRDEGNAASFREEVRSLLRHGKPVAVTEFGCCTYRGAAARGGVGWNVVDQETEKLDGDYVRDEAEQAAYLRELLEVFDQEGVDTAFWFTFALRDFPHRPDEPRGDLDLASYGVVKVLPEGHSTAYPDMAWETKESFHALAAAYAP